MKQKKAERGKSRTTSLVRASISFPPELYEMLEGLAKQKKVSLAWVVRDAAERYVADGDRTGDNGQKLTTHSTGARRSA